MRHAVVAGVVLVLALGACGSGSSSSSSSSSSSKVSTTKLVTAAPAAAVEAESAHISGRMTVTADGRTIEIPLTADTDFRTGATEMRMDVSGIPQMPGSGEFDVRLVDGAMYMRLGSLLGTLTPGAFAGKQWVAFDPGELGMSQGQIATQNPADMLDSLRGAGDVTLVGSEDVDGVSTRHFRAEVDTAHALAKAPAETRHQAQAFLDTMGAHFPMDVWIDDDGLPRRFEMHLSVPGTGTVSMRMDFGDYGKPVDVSAPPADETISFSDLQSLGAGAT